MLIALQVAPIAVYTSGKGSSAAGLTASVQRDPVSVRRVLLIVLFLYVEYVLSSESST